MFLLPAAVNRQEHFARRFHGEQEVCGDQMVDLK